MRLKTRVDALTEAVTRLEQVVSGIQAGQNYTYVEELRQAAKAALSRIKDKVEPEDLRKLLIAAQSYFSKGGRPSELY